MSAQTRISTASTPRMDPGVYMRELGRAALQHEVDRSRRSGETFVLAFVDVDGLKALNDVHGHAAGGCAAAIRRGSARVEDAFIRSGRARRGDEFLCEFTNMGLDASERRIDEIRAAVTEGTAGGFQDVSLPTPDTCY